MVKETTLKQAPVRKKYLYVWGWSSSIYKSTSRIEVKPVYENMKP
jgi:hypothetical protein